MKLKTCKKVCKECPFKKNSLNGYLGEHNTKQIKDAVNKEGLFSCHIERFNNEKVNQKKIEIGEQSICRGFLISATKSCKVFGQNPITGPELRKLQNEIQDTPIKDYDNIMTTWEFKKHHSND